MESSQNLAPEVSAKYVLGLDVGSASLGWAMVRLSETGNPVSLMRTGVRIFEPGVDGTSLEIEQGKDQSKAVERRTARLHRRQLRRRAARQRELFALLQRNTLLMPMPDEVVNSSSAQRHALLNTIDSQITLKFAMFGNAGFAGTPLYQLRKRALDERLEVFELGRVFVHLSQRRGFQSNRKDTKKNPKDNEDLGQVKAEIHALELEIAASGARTLGEYFAGLDPHTHRIRRRWTARSMFKDEFEQIWNSQQPHYPEIMTAELHDAIAELLYFQRPIAAQSHLIGKCGLEPDKQRAPWATMPAQRFRILQKVNDIRLIVPGSLDGIPLTADQRSSLFTLLDCEGDQSFPSLRKHLGLEKTVQFNFERGEEKSIRGNRTQKSMLKVFGERWHTFGDGKQHQIIENWRNSESDDLLRQEAIEHLGLDDEGANRLLAENPEPDYCSLSLKAIERLMPFMQDDKSFKEAETLVYGTRFTGQQVHGFLPPVRKHLTSLRNPAVERALTEMRKVVNAILREYGKPYEIRIELARELKKPRQERIKASKDMGKRRKEREDVAKRIALECGLHIPSRFDIEKAMLHIECGGICPYTGRSVPFHNLFNNSEFDVEHIIPRSRFPDDSFQNKTLCYLPENREYKRNRTPFEAYSNNEELWSQILQRVRSWPQANRGKLDRFLLSDAKELEGFSSRQMNDTRHTSVLAGRLLETLYGGRDIAEATGTRQVIFASSGKVTATLRRSWGLEGILQEMVPAAPGESRGKPRVDHRHHAIDAITIALTSQGVIQDMARTASLEPWQEGSRSWRKIVAPWKNFVDSIRPHIEQMIVSHRPEHKMSGELHKGTNYSRPYNHNGKPTVHSRCALTSLSASDIEAEDVIVDRAVRDAVRSKLAELGGNPKLFEKPENTPYLTGANGHRVPIRKVRVRETKNPIRVGQGVRERFVASGGIHHVALFVTRDQMRREKWDSEVIQITEAYDRVDTKSPVISPRLAGAPDAEFLFSIMKDDTIEISHATGTQILRVKKFSENKQMWFVPVNDAHDDGQQMKLGITWSKKPNTLKDLKPRKVVVDLLGRVHPTK
jgi:CRISPR-associated endonuclease Csn1